MTDKPAFYIHPSDLTKLSNNATSSRTVTAYRAHPEFERDRAGCVPVYSEPLNELTESAPARLRCKLADSMRRELNAEFRLGEAEAARAADKARMAELERALQRISAWGTGTKAINTFARAALSQQGKEGE